MDNNSTSHHDDVTQDLTIAILAFTVAGFCLSLYATGKVLWKSVTNVSPRNITNEEAGLIATNIMDKLKDNESFIAKVAGAVADHDKSD